MIMVNVQSMFLTVQNRVEVPSTHKLHTYRLKQKHVVLDTVLVDEIDSYYSVQPRTREKSPPTLCHSTTDQSQSEITRCSPGATELESSNGNDVGPRKPETCRDFT